MYLENKYTKWYESITNKAKDRTLPMPYEVHHIIPKSLGGSNRKDNLVKLTSHEHIICHILLTKMLTGANRAKMIYAASIMAGKSKGINTRTLAKLRELHSQTKKEYVKVHGPSRGTTGMKFDASVKKNMSEAKKGECNPMFNLTHSSDAKKLMSDLKSGSNNPMYGKRGVLSPSYGRAPASKNKKLEELHSPEETSIIRAKFSNSAKNRKQLTCPHCNKMGHPSNMKRWHFENCKRKSDV
jgi:hypothetical protein